GFPQVFSVFVPKTQIELHTVVQVPGVFVSVTTFIVIFYDAIMGHTYLYEIGTKLFFVVIRRPYIIGSVDIRKDLIGINNDGIQVLAGLMQVGPLMASLPDLHG